MSQLNHNQENNTGGGAGGGYHQKRNISHRNSTQPFAHPQQQGGFIPGEFAGYSSMYSSIHPATMSYYGRPPLYTPYIPMPAAYQGMEHHHNHQINLTTQTGEKVDLKGLKATTPKQSHLPLNSIGSKVPHIASSTHQRTPSVTPATPADPNTQSKKEMFKAAILAKANANANANPNANANATATINSNATASASTNPTATATATASASASATASADATSSTAAQATSPGDALQKVQLESPKKENIPPNTVSTTTTTNASTQQEVLPPVQQQQDSTDLLKKEKVEEPQPEAPKLKQDPIPSKNETEPQEVKEETPKQEQPEQSVKEEPKQESQPPQEEQPAADAAADAVTDAAAETKEDSEVLPSQAKPEEEAQTTPKAEEPSQELSKQQQEPQEPQEPQVPQEPSNLTLSEFLLKVSEATPIKDPYTFKYPPGTKGPNPELRKKCKVSLRYDPQFLLQFAPKAKIAMDPKFKEKIGFVLDNLVDRGGKGGNGGGGGGYRGGFGQGSIQGIQGQHFVKSQTNLRKFNNMDSRSNSRQGSKRKGGSGRGASDRKSNRNRGEKEFEKEKEPQPAEPAEPVKPLEKSANRWVPKSRAKKDGEVKYAPDGVTPLLTEEEVTTKCQSLLNKLTLEYFDSITDDILNIANQSRYEKNAETLKLVVRAIFDKATDEPHWAGMYAQLCAKLCKRIQEDVQSVESNCGGGKLARLLLLSTCQLEYERGWTVNLPTNEDGSAIEPEMMTDEYYKVAAAKRRGLGLVRFIGHLFVLRLLSNKVVNACISKLTENIQTPTDDVVENLVQLLKTTGPRIDKDDGGEKLLNNVFEKVRFMSEKAKLPSRLRFSLLDLIDLRAGGWKSDDADKGPKTLTEIRESENKKKEEERARAERQKRGGESRSNSSRGVWGNRNISISDMKKVGKFSTPRSSSDLGPLNNFPKSKSKSNRFQLNSPSTSSFDSASKNSSPLGARESSKRNVSSNSFHLLGDHNDDDDDDDSNDEKKDGDK